MIQRYIVSKRGALFMIFDSKLYRYLCSSEHTDRKSANAEAYARNRVAELWGDDDD
jgi:hypothetical protein